MPVVRWNYPTIVRFGVGAIAQLPDALTSRGVRRPLLVTDRGLPSTRAFAAVEQSLRDAGLEWSVFSDLSPNPTAPEVMAGAQQFRASGCDCIVGVGGGSGLDGAKAVQLMAHHPGDIAEYDERVGGDAKIGGHPLPAHFAVPTTAGTGSEVGRATVIVNLETREKMVIFHPTLMPTEAIVDPAVMYALPAHLTAATGMDALTHNVEAYLARGYHPLADGIALEGIRLVRKYLERAVANGEDEEARTGMAAASLMGATAFQKGLGVTHSLAHPLSTLAHMHHGLANGILIPFAMEYNARAVPERFVELAHAAGLRVPDDQAGAAFVAWLHEFKDALDIPDSLADAGVDEALLDELTAQAVRDGCHGSNPKAVSEADMRMLYQRAFAGRASA